MNQDARDLLLILNRHAIPFLVVGSHALAHHGYTREIHDLDIFIPNNCNIIGALREFGLPDLPAAMGPDSIIRYAEPPNRIDITNIMENLEFPAAWANRESGLISDIPVYFPSLADLWNQKTSTGRVKDLMDSIYLLRC